MRSLKLFNHIVKHFKGFALASFFVLASSLAQASYYNLGTMLQGPKLVFSVQPSSSTTVGMAFSTQPSVSIVKPNGSIISSATDSIVLSAYTDSRCTTAAGGSLTAASNPKAAVSGVAAFTSTTYSATGKIYIKASAPGKKSACSAPVVVTQAVVAGPDPAQFKLALLGPTSIGTSNCTAYAVALRDQFDGIVTTTTSISVKYSGAGSGSFYSDSGCTAATTTGSIAANNNQTTVYYKSAVIESNFLQVSDQASQVVDGAFTVNVLGYKLSLTGPQTIDTGTTCATYNIQYSLSGGGAGGVTNVDITGYQGAIYSNSGCTTVITGSGPVATNGSGVATFYLKGPVTQTGVPFYITINAAGAASASLAVGVATGTITKLVWSGSLTPVTSRCTPYNVTAQDASSVIQSTPNAISVTLTKTNSAVFYSDNSCKISTSSTIIPAGSSQVTMYLKDTVVESSVLTAQASGLTQGQITVTVSSGGAPKVSAGLNHTCALMADQTVRCWGDNNSGQLGNGTTVGSSKPVLVQGLTGVTSISAGNNFTCALLTTGTVKCWGEGTLGQLGNSSNITSNTPVAVSSLSSITAITAGAFHACAMGASTVSCWGQGTEGQLGNGATINANSPVNTNTLGGTPMAISAGGNHTCAIISGGSVKCWGLGTSGQIGNSASVSVSSPASVTGITGATALSSGTSFSCALISGIIKCWGNNNYSQLGDGTTTTRNSPVQVNGINTATMISSGSFYVCALLSTNSIQCWGRNNLGQLGNNSSVDSTTPATVSNISSAVVIAAGSEHSCAILADQTTLCWGSNSNGQLGNGQLAISGFGAILTTPTLASSPTSVKSVAAGNSSTCALLNNNSIKCWGNNLNGQLGNNSTTSSFSPVNVDVINNATAISLGASFGCALLSTQQIKCWGSNGYGQLGDNSNTQAITPVFVNTSEVSTATAVAAGGSHTCALLANQTVKCWGRNNNGQLGDNTGIDSSTPVLVNGISNAIAISVGGNHSCALLSDQKIKCWGNNSKGQLGNNSTGTSVLAPVLVTGITTAIALPSGTGAYHTCAILSDQTIKCWGSNLNGQLGNNSTVDALTPVSVTGITNAYSISLGGSVGSGHSCALLTDKSMRCWGKNDSGQLGTGNTTNSSVPVNVLSISPYNSVSTSSSHTCGAQPDQTIKCSGLNSYGQSGLNTLVPGYVLEIPQ